jgi:hypothetical protein
MNALDVVVATFCRASAILEKALLTFLNGEIECAHLSIIVRVLPAKIVVKMNSPNEKCRCINMNTLHKKIAVWNTEIAILLADCHISNLRRVASCLVKFSSFISA